ncbi:MAG: pyridoxamine 5'-phosphate oxidase family protein [Actinomycetota bacterium]|nr:pyridoxamine 5'-phosphate oxidase family protein [Actinomycetota bacterium]
MEPITEAKALELLEDSLVAHIGVVVDGEPYVTPMSFIVDGKRILFRTKSGRRFSGIEANPVVSIEASKFDEETGDWTSVIVKGVATVATDDATIQAALSGLFDKYRQVLGSPLSRGGMQPISSFPHVVAVEISEITGMSSSGPFSVRTRPGRL